MNPLFIDGLALLETAGGKKTIKGPNGEDSFNLFNIKDFSGKGFRALDKAEGSRDAYRVYASPEDAKQDLLGLLGRKYPDALKAETPEQFARALKAGGYATDPLYETKLATAIRRVSSTATPDPNAELIRIARERGYSEEEIRAKLKEAGPDLGRVGATVTSLAGTDEDPTAIVIRLKQNPDLAPIIETARDRGYSDAEIASKLGGREYANFTAVSDEVKQRGALSRAASGARYALEDTGRAVSQLYSRATGDDQGLTRKQAEQAQAQTSPERAAVLNSTAGAVGNVGAKVVPSLIAGAATGGSSILGQAAVQGALGAAQGALTPTTDEGQLGQNVALGGGLGALGGAGGAALARAPSILVKSTQKGIRGNQSAQELTEARDALVKEGITPSAADISTRAARGAQRLEQNVALSTSLGADKRALREPEIARVITKGIGAPADEVSSAVVKQAQRNISKLYDDALDGVDISVSGNFLGRLDDVVAKQEAGSLPSLLSRLPESVATDIKKIAEEEGTISARRLQAIRSSIGQSMTSTDNAAAKLALGDIRDAIGQELQAQLPQANLAKFNKANEYYRNLQAVENYVRRTNDTGEFSPKKFLISTTIENKPAFERGDAPYQELLTNFAANQVPSNPFNVDAVTKAVGLGALTSPAAPLTSGIAGNLAMRILTDPKWRDVLLGLNPVQRATLMRQAAAARAAGTLGGAVAAQAGANS